MRFWLSWVGDEVYHESIVYAWQTGKGVYCAVVDAFSEEEARLGLNCRFCDEKPDDWLPSSGRFPIPTLEVVPGGLANDGLIVLKNINPDLYIEEAKSLEGFDLFESGFTYIKLYCNNGYSLNKGLVDTISDLVCIFPDLMVKVI